MITNRVGAPGWPRGFQTAPAVLSRVDANERRTKMRMFNILPRLIKNTVKNLTHFTCNSPSPIAQFYTLNHSCPQSTSEFRVAGSGLKLKIGNWYWQRWILATLAKTCCIFYYFIFTRKKKLVGRRCIIIGGITIF